MISLSDTAIIFLHSDGGGEVGAKGGGWRG